MLKNKLILLFFIFILLSFSSLAALNETGNTKVTITSAAPYVISVFLEDNLTSPANELDLNASGGKLMNCTGYVNDTDGLADISAVIAEIYGSSGSFGGANNDGYHYSSNCSFSTSTGYFNCIFPRVQFYAEAGTWTCNVTVNDSANSNDINGNTTTMNTLLAIDIPDQAFVIDFGSVAIGQVSNNQSVVFENEGNVAIDVDLDVWEDPGTLNSADAMNCTTGTIPVANINASLNDSEVNISLATSGMININASLAKATGNAASPTNDTMYFILRVPNSGVSGICTGDVFFGATTAS